VLEVLEVVDRMIDRVIEVVDRVRVVDRVLEVVELDID
jgi:hypothetical protein